MTYNRLGALLTTLFGLGWLIAIAISLFLWTPKTAVLGIELWYTAEPVLTFVGQNEASWQLFHYAVNLGLIALIILIPLFDELFTIDPRRRAMSTVGVIGAVFLLLASLIDQFGTAVLARHLEDNPVIVLQIWEWMEPWRSLGLKATSYWLLGLWLLWLSSHFLLLEGAKKFGRFSQIAAIGLLWLGFVKTVIPPPLVYYLDETGAGSLVLLFFPVWGFWLARWFWQ